MTQKKAKIEPVHIEEAEKLRRIFDDRPHPRLSQAKFGDQYEIGSQGVVWQYLNARIPLNVEQAVRFARGLNCSVADFSPRLAAELAELTDSRDADHGNDNLDRPLLPSSNSSRSPASLDSNLTPGPAMKGRVPLISSVQAGMWTEIIDNFQPGDAEAWVECHRDLGPHGYALRVKGESMTAPIGEYSFPHGMILYVNPSAEPLPGKFVVVRRNGHEATFKRLTLVDGEMYLEAINPDWPNRYIKLTQDDHICGVVVYAGLELP